MKKALLLLITSSSILANSGINLQLPSSPSTYGQDSFRTGDMDCKNAIGAATNFEFGITGIIDNSVGLFGEEDKDNPTTKDMGLYARLIIPLDGPKERINCNTLYKLELQKKRLEVRLLEKELENLKSLQNNFEN
jgi:hypothetical protein